MIFAFETFTETPTTPSTLGFGITHQLHEGGEGAKLADTSFITISMASGAHANLRIPTVL